MAVYGIGQRRRGSGIKMPGIAGATWRRGTPVYMSAADGRWYPADADTVVTMPPVGIATDTIAAVGQRSDIILLGLFGRQDWTWTRGDPIYVSQVAGGLTQTAPAEPARRQPIAVAITSTLIYVLPSQMEAVHSLIDYEVQTGIIAEPTTASKGNGHAVEVYNSTEGRTFLWLRCNADTEWMGVELL